MHHPSPTRLAALVYSTTVVSALAACGSGSDRPPAAGRVVASTDLGVIATNPAITARDVGASGLLDGRSVWVYGDTFLGSPDETNRTLLSDSWSWTYDMDASDGIAGFLEPLDSVSAPRMLLPETDEERAFNEAHLGDNCSSSPCGARWALWPTSIVEDVERERALVFYSLVYARPGSWNFDGVGQSIAIWNDPEQPLERPVIDPLAEHPTLLFEDGDPAFGSAAVIHGDYLYSYGCKLREDQKPCKLGRVEIEHLYDRSRWQYFAGDAWSSNIDAASTVFNGNDMMTVGWNAYLGRYLAVYSRVFSNSVVMRTAETLEGPWSSEEVLFTAQKPLVGDNVYDALAHAEYARDDGRIIYVTYSRATDNFRSEQRLVSVELAREVTP